MKKFSKALDTRDLAALPQVRYEGDPNLVINSASTPQEATKSSVIFLENEKLFEAVEQSEAGLIITTPEFALKLEGRNLLITEKPYFAMMVILEKWLALEKPKEPGIHASAGFDRIHNLGGLHFADHFAGCFIAAVGDIGVNFVAVFLVHAGGEEGLFHAAMSPGTRSCAIALGITSRCPSFGACEALATLQQTEEFVHILVAIHLFKMAYSHRKMKRYARTNNPTDPYRPSG